MLCIPKCRIACPFITIILHNSAEFRQPQFRRISREKADIAKIRQKILTEIRSARIFRTAYVFEGATSSRRSPAPEHASGRSSARRRADLPRLRHGGSRPTPGRHGSISLNIARFRLMKHFWQHLEPRKIPTIRQDTYYDSYHCSWIPHIPKL